MGFDIKYLLMLQDLRNATGGIFDEVFNAISKIAVDIMIFLPYLIFWGFSKDWGYRFLVTDWAAEFINGIIKLTACVYRPWIRCDKIEPAGDSKVAATGYSFPSGHTTKATAMYGTVAVWQYKKRKWLAILCGAAILLTGFSRNFLGVHTPQDVLVGFLATCILVYVVGLVQEKIKDNEKLKDTLTFAGFAVVAIAIVYVLFKPYPLDYVDGELLVDPTKMQKDFFSGCGGVIGLLVGSYIDRHYTHYKIPYEAKNLALLSGVGLGIVFSWKTYLAKPVLVAALGANVGHMLSAFLIVMFGIVIWPMVIMKLKQTK